MQNKDLKVSMRGNRIQIEMSDEYADVLLRVGLQVMMDKISAEKGKQRQVVVLPVEECKAKPAEHVLDLSKEEVELCLQEGVLEVIRSMLLKHEQEELSSKCCANCGTKTRKHITGSSLSYECCGERFTEELPSSDEFCCVLCVVEAFRKDFTKSVIKNGKKTVL